MGNEPEPEYAKRQQPEHLRLRSITPALTVEDLDVSLTWYRNVLRCYVADTWEHEGAPSGAYLKAGAMSLVLLQDDGAMGRKRARKGDGFRLYLTTTQDVDELAAQIKARGGRLDSEPRDLPWGARAFAITDPDGFRLTISSDP
ncbi:MAG TPA: VOC family protein [Longimicrobiales bacterium]|jgi:predicted enzyme related to lactoylglutathione lyase